MLGRVGVEGRLVIGLLWVFSLDALGGSENAVKRFLAVAQVLGCCFGVLFWAAERLFFNRREPKEMQTPGASLQQRQLLAEHYRAMLEVAINETISRQAIACAHTTEKSS
jgi:hypothetical protein